MDIRELIPQRDPFLFIDKIKDLSENSITVEMTFPNTLDFFKGHFPQNPIVPGVILCEHCFQSGAALITSQLAEGGLPAGQMAVLSRITSAKFKSIISPDETIITTTTLIEKLDNAAYFKSTIRNIKDKKVLMINFACTLIADNKNSRK